MPRSIRSLSQGSTTKRRVTLCQVPGKGPVIARMQVLDHEDRQFEVRGKRREDSREPLDAARRTADDDGPVVRSVMAACRLSVVLMVRLFFL